MREKPPERRLAAIMASDMVGYSRLMGADEEGTLHQLRSYRRELIDPVIAERGGHIIKAIGDGLLVEFPSAVEAVACAITVQRNVAATSASVPEDHRFTFRIGINVGDVVFEGGDIFGDGVNVAARLEKLCEPGGLCISRAVRDQVRDKLPISFEDHGEQSVKNIARPIRVFGLTPQAIAALPNLPPPRHTVRPDAHRRWIAAAALAALVAAGGSTWWAKGLPSLPWWDATSRATARASIAVLPFVALGTDDNHFADGLSEDLITALGRFQDLSVISRSGTTIFKGRSPTLEEVKSRLGVRYVVEGSVRRAPDRVRVTATLADTERGTLLWSHRMEVEPKDSFAIQEQIARQVSGALAIRVTDLELSRLAVKPPKHLEAYDLVLRGRDLLSRGTRSSNVQARSMFERAIQLDPNYAPAYVGLGRVDLASATQGWTPVPLEVLRRAESRARRAIELDDLSPGSHSLMGRVALYLGDHDRASTELRRAIDLNGSDAEALGGLLSVLLWAGDAPGAIAAGETLAAFQVNLTPIEAFHLGTAYILANRANDAIRLLANAVDRNRANMYTHAALAMAYAEAGRREDAERQAALIRSSFPTFSREEFGSLLREPALRNRLSGALQKAGL
jgi:adenylate cyclase